jgi:hypothetical protein
MSSRSLNELVSRAVVSDEFRAGILNGKRAELLRGFNLEPDEVAQVMAIRANTLQEFSAAIERLMGYRDIRPSFLSERILKAKAFPKKEEASYVDTISIANLYPAL